MIIKNSNVLIVHALAIILVYMSETISASTSEPKFCGLFILSSSKVDIGSIVSLELIWYWRIVEAHNFTIMGLNALYLFICRIERWCRILLQIMNSNIPSPVTTSQVLSIRRYFNASELFEFSLLLSWICGILLGCSIFI